MKHKLEESNRNGVITKVRLFHIQALLDIYLN